MLKKTQNQELSEEGEAAAAPEAGTSSDGEKKTGAKKYDFGIKRGPANPIGVGKWSETEGTQPIRGHANPLSEISFTKGELLREFSDRNLFGPDGLQIGIPSMSDIGAELKKAGNNALNSAKSYGNQAVTTAKSYGNQAVKSTISAFNQAANSTKNFFDSHSAYQKKVYKADDGDSLLWNVAKGEFPEAILDLREVMFTDGFIVGEVIINILFSETIVVPVATAVLNGMVLVNDWAIYSENQEDEEAFGRVIEDLALIAGMGLLKIAGKGIGKGFRSWLKSSPGNKRIFIKLMRFIKGAYNSIVKGITETKMPKALKNWLMSKTGGLRALADKAESFIQKYAPEAIAKITARKLSKAVVGGLVAYVGVKALNKLLGLAPDTDPESIKGQEALNGLTISADKKAANLQDQKDLEAYKKSNDLAAVAKKLVAVYAKSYPCLGTYYKKGLFTVQIESNLGYIYIINKVQYVDDRTGIYSVETNTEFKC